MNRNYFKSNIEYGLHLDALTYRRNMGITKEKLSFHEKLKLIVARARRGSVQIPHIDLVVSTKCSLRCKYCTQWNPYIKSPRIFSADEVLSDLKMLLDKVDYVSRIAVIGGEALLNPEISQILECLLSQKKVGQVLLITNGTIWPKGDVLEILKKSKIEIWIDRYLNFSKAADRLVQFCEQNRIPYRDEATPIWYDIGYTLEKKHHDLETVKKNWDTCWLRNCATMIGSKLYRCCRTFVLENNGIEDANQNYIDFAIIQNKIQAQKELRKLYGLPYIEACAYCNEVDYSRRLVPGREQVRGE